MKARNVLIIPSFLYARISAPLQSFRTGCFRKWQSLRVTGCLTSAERGWILRCWKIASFLTTSGRSPFRSQFMPWVLAASTSRPPAISPCPATEFCSSQLC